LECSDVLRVISLIDLTTAVRDRSHWLARIR
jgi:hypothetical protein